MTVRTLCIAIVATLVSRFVSPADAAAQASGPALDGLIASGYASGWDTLAIGDRVACYGASLRGIPYVEATLEAPGSEVCRVRTDGFDCVTFMELALNLARVTTHTRATVPTANDVIDAVTFTRYRGGRIDGYVSRLHYTSEWIADNVAKGVIADVTPSLGGKAFPVHVGFMSKHPDRYPALHGDPAAVDSMRSIEHRINATRRTHIPKERIAAIETRLQTGDLVAITTSIDGLDYAHTGIIVREGRTARLLHASSGRKSVVLDDRISAYLARAPKSFLGITVLRPKPVREP